MDIHAIGLPTETTLEDQGLWGVGYATVRPRTATDRLAGRLKVRISCIVRGPSSRCRQKELS